MKNFSIRRTFAGISLSVAVLFGGGMFVSSNTAQAAVIQSKPSWEKKADAIIAEAKRLMPIVQYQYSKNDPKRMIFDCSSFTKYLYAKQGVKLWWGARRQYTDNTKISRSNLRKGDLVFFSTPATAKNTDKVKRIGHVGIYIGNGKIIHNVNPKSDVVIADMTKGWWNTHYVAAARVLK